MWNNAATERIRKFGVSVVPGDLFQRNVGDPIEIAPDEGELATAGISIDAVVLPLPGYDVRYPENDIGQFYEQKLKSDGVTFCKKGVPEESTAKGSYRRLISFAENLSFETVPTEHDLLHVKFKFALVSGSYATMLLRELMLQTCTR